MKDALISELKRWLKESKNKAEQADDPEEKRIREAYSNGFEAAFDLVLSHYRQERLNSQHTGKDPALPAERPKLYDLKAPQVSRNWNEVEEKEIIEMYTRLELTEAAFRFENELMGMLGDDNSMEYEAYDGLNNDQLVRIIRTSVTEICRLENKS